VGKDDEYVLVGLLASDRVDKGFLNFWNSATHLDSGRRTLTRIVHVQVTPEDSPKNSLKSGHLGPLDGTRNKLEIES
jgi:hypothetical protein